MRAAGFVLTGGNSSRMGSDKALLTLGDDRLVQVVATALATVASPVSLVGRPNRYSHLPWRCLPDLRLDVGSDMEFGPGLGPLAGLESALASTEAELNLVVACDMPGLQTRWLRALLDFAECSVAPCVATRDAKGRVHPLCAVYRRSCLPAISRALDERRLKLTRLVEELQAEYLQIDTALENVNTPTDWAEWQHAHLRVS